MSPGSYDDYFRMKSSDFALEQLAVWWDGLPKYKRNDDLPAWGAIAGALVVLDRLQETYSLNIDDHLARAGMQIAGLGQPRVTRILERFGLKRPLPSEAGRTNPGTIPQVRALLQAIAPLRLDSMAESDRRVVLTQMQGWLVHSKLRQYPEPRRIKFQFSADRTTWAHVHDLLTAAGRKGKAGQVAQYLVGAKLALRFPDADVRNDSYSTADAPSGQPGDFVVGDTVFHVTVSPTPAHYDKCRANLAAGYEVMLLVPQDLFSAIDLYMKKFLPGRATVDSIEAFVARNLEDLGGFTRSQRISRLRMLLELYNRRVDAVEPDKSLLIELPRNLPA